MAENLYDIAVIGGGINGCGIARDASGRGLKVLLCEKDDLAEHTSSASTKLIHGGLRYLENYEFRLVRESLGEREVLLRSAPHIIWPMRFVLPHNPGLRPAWMIRVGLFLYDHLGGRKLLPGSKAVNLTTHPAGRPLKKSMTQGFAYSDCWVQDARLVVLNAKDAAERGADILTRTRCVKAERGGDEWTLHFTKTSGEEFTRRARCIVNAAGPWVADFIDEATTVKREKKIRLVKGSHIVVRKLFEHDHAYIFQNADQRIIFAIPYERDFTLIGTTDQAYNGNAADVKISPDEITYLCSAASEYFAEPVTEDSVVWAYSGVRPLYDDANSNVSKVTRDYTLSLLSEGGAPILSIYGGKLTTYRELAEKTLEKLKPVLEFEKGPWTAKSVLPGGDIPDADFDGFLERFSNQNAWMPSDLAWRYAREYGTRAQRIVGGADSLEGLGEHLGDEVYSKELEYLVNEEWAQTTDDILWRRSKLGLHISVETKGNIEQWLARFFDSRG